MTKDVSKKIKDIANRFCNMSLDEILKLPDPAGYEFIDGFYDQVISSRQFISEVKIYEYNIVSESHFYRPDEVEQIVHIERDDIVYKESDIVWAA